MVNKKSVKAPIKTRTARKIRKPRNNLKGDYPCPVCGTKYNFRSSMKNHERTHYLAPVEKVKLKRVSKNVAPLFQVLHENTLTALQTITHVEDEQLHIDPELPMGGDNFSDAEEQGPDNADKDTVHEEDQVVLNKEGDEVVGGDPLLFEPEDDVILPPPIFVCKQDNDFRDDYWEGSDPNNVFNRPPLWDHDFTRMKAMQGCADTNDFNDVFEGSEINRDLLQFSELSTLSLPNQMALHALIEKYARPEVVADMLSCREINELAKMSEHKGLTFIQHNLYNGNLYNNTTMSCANSIDALVQMMQSKALGKEIVSINKELYIPVSFQICLCNTV